MGQVDVNVGYGRYLEDVSGGPTMMVGIWAGKGSTPVHDCAAFGELSDTGAIDDWKACRDASTSQTAFYAELLNTAPSVHAEVTSWPSGVQTLVYEAAKDARINGREP